MDSNRDKKNDDNPKPRSLKQPPKQPHQRQQDSRVGGQPKEAPTHQAYASALPHYSSLSRPKNDDPNHPEAETAAAAAVEEQPSRGNTVPVVNDICHELPDLVRSHVHDSIVSEHAVVPKQDAEAYLQAWHANAALVRTETDPLQFVRACHYDLWAGAKRLCRYWTERLRLFGPERAFLPLCLTGTGALTMDEVNALPTNQNTILVLPDSQIGQQCILIDRRRWLELSHAEKNPTDNDTVPLLLQRQLKLLF